MKTEIHAFDYAPHIAKQLANGGILVTAKVGDKVNPITVGWGTMGIQWGKPLFQAYIRESRYTKGLLDTAGAFTVNIPLTDTARTREILAFCGSHSGRDTDKVNALGLTLVAGTHTASPAIAELPLTLECKVIYAVRQDGRAMPPEVLKRYYPDWDNHPEDVHTVYYGEILAAYLVDEKTV